MRFLLTLFVVLASLSFEDAVLFLSGAEDISEIGEDDFEAYRYLAAHPVAINKLDRAGLLGCGLFSSYQVETILDWRQRHGDIGSVAELGVVDGFTSRSAEALEWFVSFGAGRGEGGPAAGGVVGRGEALGGAGVRIAQGQAEGRWMAKGCGEVCGRAGAVEAAVAARSDWARPVAGPGAVGWCVGWRPAGRGPSLRGSDSRRSSAACGLVSATLGCFNVRFGQGLLAWSGTSIESFSSPAALMRKPTGIVPYRGWSPSNAMAGGAVRADFGRLSFRPFIDLGDCLTTFGAGEPRLRGGGNIAWNHSGGQFGATALFDASSSGVSLDFQQTWAGLVTYGEACIKFEGGSSLPSALAGATYQGGTAGGGVRFVWSPYEHQFALAGDLISDNREHSVNCGVLGSFYPLAKGHTPEGAAEIKVKTVYKAVMGSLWRVEVRGDAKLRALTRYSDVSAPYAGSWGMRRFELRAEAGFGNVSGDSSSGNDSGGGSPVGGWSGALRLDGVYGRGPAFLGYASGGWSGGVVRCVVQGGVFRVDEWDDRIYVYMNDAPGGFNVPALYGRGWFVNAYCVFSFGKHFKLYLRTVYTDYPWARPTDTHRHPSLESRLQLNFKLL